MDLLNRLLLEPHEPKPAAGLDAWWDEYRRWMGLFEDDAFAAACVTSLRQDRLAWVIASAYSAAIHTAFPPSDDSLSIASFCVTEPDGNTPRAMTVRLQGDELHGVKSFATLGSDADRLVVLAVANEPDAWFKDLVLVEVDRAQPEVRIEPLEPTPFAPELGNAKVTFSGAEARVIEKDGWQAVKFFRMMEDKMVLGAASAFLLGLARQTGQADRTMELLSIVASLIPLKPGLRGRYWIPVAYEGARRRFERVLDEFDWDEVATEVQENWRRDRSLLSLAATARDARLSRSIRHFDLTRAKVLRRWEWRRSEGSSSYEGYVVWTDDDWLEFAEWEVAPHPHAAGGGDQRTVTEFMKKGGPSWAPESIVNDVRQAIEARERDS